MRKKILTSLLTLVLASGAAFSQVPAPRAGIKIVGMTPYTLTVQYKSQGSKMFATTGLNTVGEKTIVYLQAIDSTGTPIQSVTWSVQDPQGGHAQIDSVNAPFTTITVDTTGQYVVTVQVQTAGGTGTASTKINSADYVGVGTIGIATMDSSTAQFPQCGLCHNDKVTTWQNTPHASFFKISINGHNPEGIYFSSCVKCHTTGYNTTAKNGNFADVAAQVGWTFPSTLVDTNFAQLYHQSARLAQLATIGCESCHGPGNQHMGDPTKISVSLDASVCMQCHDAPPHHVIGREWTNSPHDSGMAFIQAMDPIVNSGSSTCARCHNGSGFVDYASKAPLQSTYTPMPLTCSSCHDPHDASNPHQLRKVTADTLMNGFAINAGGVGQLCMNCHRSRANAVKAVSSGWKSYFGPHEGPQTDMFWGQNGYQFGDSTITGISTHTQLKDACVTCHMSTDTLDSKATNLLGGHTWKMSGPDSTGTIVDNTTACQQCHGPITDFDQIQAPRDYAGLGYTAGVQTEVKALLDKLASLLPDSVLANPSSPTVGKGLSPNQLGALYDYLMVLKDKSYGVHNAKYTFALLTRAIGTLTGVKIVSDKTPKTYSLDQNYPNPFNPTTTINFSVPKTEKVRLTVYNELGQLVKTLVNDSYAPGTYQVTWDGTNQGGNQVSSGVYFYKFETNNYTQTRKMILLK